MAQLEQLVAVLTELDLRYGGGLVSQISKALLRWSVVMQDAAYMPAPVKVRLAATVSALAARAGWSAFDVSAHEAARSLFRLALYTTARAGDPDLRAHILADVAAQHNQLGYHQDALEMIRLGEGDERVAPPVRMVLHGVKARIYAALGDADQCRRQIDQAETIYAGHGRQTDPEPGWVATLLHPGHLFAATGHAMATLAGHTGAKADAEDARRRLAKAVEELDPAIHARAHALAAARLASCSSPQETWTRAPATPALRSSRPPWSAPRARHRFSPRSAPSPTATPTSRPCRHSSLRSTTRSAPTTRPSPTPRPRPSQTSRTASEPITSTTSRNRYGADRAEGRWAAVADQPDRAAPEPKVWIGPNDRAVRSGI